MKIQKTMVLMVHDQLHLFSETDVTDTDNIQIRHFLIKTNNHKDRQVKKNIMKIKTEKNQHKCKNKSRTNP